MTAPSPSPEPPAAAPAPASRAPATSMATLVEPIRVLLVDDYPMARDNLARVLDRLGGIKVVGQAGDGAQALELAEELQPQVVLMDLRMPKMDGVEATRLLVERHPEIAVLILSAYGDEGLVIDALTAGARGYLLKGTQAPQLAEAIVGAANGQARIAGQVTRPILERLVEALSQEREIARLAEEARQASERISRRQQQFATVAAHELRTPVTAVLGSLQTLERLIPPDKLPSAAAELLAASTRQARRLARLVEDLTVVAKGASGGITVKPAMVDVGETIASVVADLDHLGGANRVRISVPPGLIAWADPDRYAQVLTNLVRNALQYSPPDQPVTVTAGSAPGVIRVAVADRGPGIPAERLPDLFDRFGDRGKTHVTGLGVGLWIVRELLTAMHGNVWVEANPEGGSIFYSAVPAHSRSVNWDHDPGDHDPGRG